MAAAAAMLMKALFRGILIARGLGRSRKFIFRCILGRQIGLFIFGRGSAWFGGFGGTFFGFGLFR
jgi:hypothetical protein